jgi:CRISPR-associated endonuclease/helicase Cas3
LARHCLNNILQSKHYTDVSAIPRIQANAELDSKHSLVNLEHTQLNARLFEHPPKNLIETIAKRKCRA